MSKTTTKKALSAVFTDLQMLKDGSWCPDDSSIDASIDMLECAAENLNIELIDTREE